MFALILTVVSGCCGYQGVAVTQVGPFATEAHCMAAATAWLKQMDSLAAVARDPRTSQRSALCAPLGKALP